ncbi:MAG TPA: ferric reductase-like transmembrane domain-containing protein [Mycobacteriales bacterium]|nr:ferric reductase-like transmembrane domain-containing protein [Mycobacteriales bacterium]
MTTMVRPSESLHEAGRPAARYWHLVPGLVLALIGAGAGAVLLLWLHDTPPVLSGLGAYLTAGGRIFGLLAGYAVVIQIVLMARIPVLERGIGADRLARWHSFGGRYTISLIAAHAALIVWGYAVTAHTGIVGQSVTLLRSYPDVLMATVAAGLFLGVGLVSARAARKRMRYETWYYLHFYTYLAVALAFSHQLATGADFLTNQPARVLWTAMYVMTGMLVAWFRIAVPVRAAFRHRLRVHSITQEAPGVISLVLYGRWLEDLAPEPGQFFRWRFLSRGEWWQSHPYSLSAPPRPPYLRITVKAVGDHTHSLQHIRPGTRVVAEGPYGAMVGSNRRLRKVLLVAGGLGITPLRALFETLPAAPGDLTLLYRVHNAEDIIFEAELRRLAAARRATVHFLVGPRKRYNPFTPRQLRSLVPDVSAHEVYLCGPPGMATAAVEALRQAGVSRRHIHNESFDL